MQISTSTVQRYLRFGSSPEDTSADLGYCPTCMARTVGIDKRNSQHFVCERGHRYESRRGLAAVPDPQG